MRLSLCEMEGNRECLLLQEAILWMDLIQEQTLYTNFTVVFITAVLNVLRIPDIRDEIVTAIEL